MKKDYKLIVSDVDGTLMDKRKAVSPKVAEAIKRWQDSGRKFTIASGRSFYMLKDELRNLEIITPVIVRGGSEIVDPTTNKIIYSQSISWPTIKEFVSLLRKNNYDLMIEKEDKYYSTFPYDAGLYPHIQRLGLDEFKNQEAPKINVRLGERNIDEFEAFANDLVNKFPELHIVRSYNDLGKSLDVTSKSATKHLAVLELLKLLGLKKEVTVGIGDGYNDFPLLEACGYKVAMGNARDELKAIADIVVPSYQEDGVAVLITKLLKQN